jgi:hypothetical protein
MLAKIIERAAALKAGRTPTPRIPKTPAAAKTPRKTTATAAKTTAKTAASAKSSRKTSAKKARA